MTPAQPHRPSEASGLRTERPRPLTHAAAHSGLGTYGGVRGSWEVKVHQHGLRRASGGRRVCSLRTETDRRGCAMCPRPAAAQASLKGRATQPALKGDHAVPVRVATQIGSGPWPAPLTDHPGQVPIGS